MEFYPFLMPHNDRTFYSFSYCTPYKIPKDPCHILELIKNLPLLFEIELMVFKIFSFSLFALLGSLLSALMDIDDVKD